MLFLLMDTKKKSSCDPLAFGTLKGIYKRGGIIINEDSWRYPVLRMKNKAKNCKEFRAVGPCRPGVTITDIFFY